ncbi:hypothetical protein [Calditerrivibrio sp.]|uniref:hypothetical protein n=1 Tax=Calditerrivibrio sp. TaxID=2792612 RepID=UPI003D0E8DA9
MEPSFCPYCGEDHLDELDPTELMVDNQKWIIYHYECKVCGEIFDKIFIDEDYGDIEDDDDDENRLWS